MEVILLEKIDNLGTLGDKVKVRAGYGRNYLIPTGRAVPATADNLKAFEAQRAKLEQQSQDKLIRAEARKVQIDALTDGVSITHKAGEEGKLFGSVGTADIAAACEAMGVEIAKSEVRLPEGPFRVAGEYEVTLHLHADVNAVLRVNIIGEE